MGAPVSRLGSIFALLALAAALLAPPGFMPAQAEDGSIAIHICSELDGGQERVMRIDPRTGELIMDAAGEDQSGEDKRCDFAGAGAADLPSLAALSAITAPFADFEPAAMDALAQLSSTGLPPSTGPPSA